MHLMLLVSPVKNIEGTYSRDFTTIANVLETNIRAITSTNTKALNTVYDVAYGEGNDLNELVRLLKENLSKFAEINDAADIT